MKTVFITGANRGVGLALAQHYAAAGWEVIASCRHPEKAMELQGLRERYADSVSVQPLDVTDADSIQRLATTFPTAHIDVLICNAGIYLGRDQSPGSINYADWAAIMDTNVFGVMRTVEAFLPYLEKGSSKTIGLMTSKMGCIADNSSGGSYLYRSSKSALNAIGKSLAIDLAPKAVNVLLLHPGWVRTDMGGPGGLISAGESASGLAEVLGSASPDTSGKFFNYAGQELPW
jgi:NAD(P)-dependent dehydrogenase (short-subunit alcohol dehydrogenase family)